MVLIWVSSFFIIAFASYVDGSEDFSQSFSDWLKVSHDCLQEAAQYSHSRNADSRRGRRSGSKSCFVTAFWTDYICFRSQVNFLRKSYGSRLNVFAPVNDLSSLSKTGSEGRALVPGKKNDMAIFGGQILGDEYSKHVVLVSHSV